MSTQSDLETRVKRPDGTVSVHELAKALLVTTADLAAATGLPYDAVGPASFSKPATQRRMGELVRILDRIMPWTGHPRIAFAWYRSQPLPSFGAMTAEDLVRMDRLSAIEAYLDRIADGGYS